MTLRVIGSGMGRTGTASLKLALEQLLGARCYHMMEVFQHPEHVALWTAAGRGERVEWPELFRGFAATVDWPAAAFWEELAELYPDAIILHSERDPEAWWKSASETIFRRRGPDEEPQQPRFAAMLSAIMGSRFTNDIHDKDAAIEAYVRTNEHVRRTAPKHRLVMWSAGDGWAPLCDALRVARPDRPFPHVNTTAEFRARAPTKLPDA